MYKHSPVTIYSDDYLAPRSKMVNCTFIFYYMQVQNVIM